MFGISRRLWAYSPLSPPPMGLWCGNCDATLLPEWLFLLLVVCRPASDVHIRSYLGSSSLPLLSVASCQQARFYYLSHHTLETEWNRAVPCCHGKTTWAISAWFGSIRFSTYSHYVLKPYQTMPNGAEMVTFTCVHRISSPLTLEPNQASTVRPVVFIV